jgi:hypothetical protein
MKRLILLILFCSLSSQAEERGNKLWKWSVVALAASTAADVHSSYGMRELNPILRGPDRPALSASWCWARSCSFRAAPAA